MKTVTVTVEISDPVQEDEYPLAKAHIRCSEAIDADETVAAALTLCRAATDMIEHFDSAVGGHDLMQEFKRHAKLSPNIVTVISDNTTVIDRRRVN